MVFAMLLWRFSTEPVELWHDDGVGVPLHQFKKMQERLSGKRRTPVAAQAHGCPGGVLHRVILGIDPSLRSTGYGIIRVGSGGATVLAQGTVACARSWERSRCLGQIGLEMRRVVQRWHPTVCVVEGLFYAQNLRTAIVMGEARGAGLAAIAEAGLEVYEIAPRRVKQAIVGYGAAGKLAVAKMVQRQLALAEVPVPDAADALALALAFAQEQGLYSPKALKRL